MAVTTRDGKHVETTSNEDPQEIENERILLEPILHGTEGLDPTKVATGMKKEIQQMKEQGVYTETDGNTLTTEQWSNIVESIWVLRPKQQEVRARMVAKGYTENISDNDLIYASTPLFCILRILLTMALSNNWSVRTGDVSVAFLHAPAATLNIIMRPPPEFYDDNSKHIMWKPNKAFCALRSSPKQWQDHIAEVLTGLELTRLKTDLNVYRNRAGTAYIMVYVDDLLFLGEQRR